MTDPDFPPLFRGLSSADPLAQACAAARDGTDAGLVTYDLAHDRLRAAIVFAPEVPLREAAVMLHLCGVGFQNALGVLGPPVVALHLDWNGAIRVNGGICGHLTMAASAADPDTIPDWLVVGLTLDLWPADGGEGGATPDRTALYAEGCSDVTAPDLLSAWVRHTLALLDTWDHQGLGAIHREWTSLAHGLNAPLTIGDQTGTFLGTDDSFGLLLKSDTTHLIPLTSLLRTDV